MIDITRKGYWEVRRGITLISRHTTPEEAYQSAASNLPCTVIPPTYEVKAKAAAPAPAPAPAPVRSGFVTRQGRELMLDGKVFRFVGTNDFSLTGCHYGAVPTDAQLDAFFGSLRPRTVTRTWAFQSSNRDAIHRVIKAAEKHDQKVMLALGEGAGHCGAPRYDAAWYRGGYTGDYFAWIRTLVPQYKDSPAIIWEIMNEPGGTGAGTQAEMKAFYHRSAELIKSLDPNHLVASGTLDSYQPFQQGTAGFADVHSSPFIDMVSVHEYEYDYSGNTGVVSRWQQNLAAAAQVGKPIYVGEFGACRKVENTTPQRRAEVVRMKFDAYLNAGASGVLMWTTTLPPNHTGPHASMAANEAWDSPAAQAIRAYTHPKLSG